MILYPINIPVDDLMLAFITVVVRRLQRGIDNPAPAFARLERRQLESQRLPVGVEHNVKIIPALWMTKRKSQSARRFTPVRVVQFGAVPGDLHALVVFQ